MHRKPIILSVIEIIAGAVTVGATIFTTKKEKDAEKEKKSQK